MEATKLVDTGALVSPGPLCDGEFPPGLTLRAPMFALIIGINDYPTIKKLRGAVADAKAINDYLQEVIHVPEAHIRTLFDGEATRDAMIKAFEALRDDKRIHNGDPIVIYYAGHGGELNPPPALNMQKRIQCLLPHDYRPASIHPIPDYTIGSLIEDIAKLKGDNITIIFDCCHSASGTRDENEEHVQSKEYLPRSVILNHTIPANLDDHIWSNRAGSIPQGWAYHGLRSHVLLAACGEEEEAFERDGRGMFTAALLTTLKEGAATSLTYEEVLRRIRLPKQSPYCEGVNRGRFLFNARVSAGRQVRHAIRSVHSIRGFKYLISAGLAHGVAHGAEFIIYNNRKERVDVVTVDDTAVIDDFQTTVTTSVYLAHDSFAELTRVGNLPFYLGPAGNPHPLLEETLRTHGTSFRLAENEEEAKLEVSVDDNLAAFRVLDRWVHTFGFTTLPYKVIPDRLVDVLKAAAQYFWYLDLANKTIPLDIERKVSIGFFPLKIDYDDYGEHMYVPVEPGLCRKDPILGDVIDFVVDPNAIYGIKITNNTPLDLYLNAFLFNNSSMSIKSYYTQSQSSNEGLEAPLKHDESFTIGYGPGGSPPFTYSLENGQDVDVSFLKVFFTTRPLDLSMIEQATPFMEAKERDLITDDARKARLSLSKLTQAYSKPADTWFTIQIPIIQRRNRSQM